MSDIGAPFAFELTRRSPSQRAAGLICGMTGYRETALGRFSQREAAPLRVPLIISLGTPFWIALGREPGAADRQPSFAAGLHVGPVHIESDGGAECVQIDFAARRLSLLRRRRRRPCRAYGRHRRCWVTKAGGCMNARATRCWQRRFDLLEDFVLQRAGHVPSSEIAFAYRRLALSAGGARITTLAEEIGWSRKHLVDRFRSELGVAPKSIARMMRFHHACRLAQAGTTPGWAGIAAESGYADQAHLAREFAALAGEPPTAWARRQTLTDDRLTHPEDVLAGW